MAETTLKGLFKTKAERIANEAYQEVLGVVNEAGINDGGLDVRNLIIDKSIETVEDWMRKQPDDQQDPYHQAKIILQDRRPERLT